MTIPERLIILKESGPYTWEELAEKLGVHVVTLYQWMRPDSNERQYKPSPKNERAIKQLETELMEEK